jgi:hypothetical protein
MDKESILNNFYKDPVIDKVINYITEGSELKDDLKQEVFIILLEMPEKRIVEAFTNNYLLYLYINILKKQWNSKTSPFYKKYKKEGENKVDELPDLVDDNMNEIEKKTNNEIILGRVFTIINTMKVVDRELLYMYYKLDKYNPYDGRLKYKEKASYKNLEKKLRLTSINGDTISISAVSIFSSCKKSLNDIKNKLKNYDNFD